jgi:hypothetical protein
MNHVLISYYKYCVHTLNDVYIFVLITPCSTCTSLENEDVDGFYFCGETALFGKWYIRSSESGHAKSELSMKIIHDLPSHYPSFLLVFSEAGERYGIWSGT